MRALVALALALLCTGPCAAGESKTYRVGFLAPAAAPAREEAFRHELRRLGYVESKNVVIEYRSADGNFDRLPKLAAELVRLDVHVIVAVRTQASIAAKNATTTIPIVMLGVGDPVASGLVTTLARPGGNITGTSGMNPQVVGKQMELIRELTPRAPRVAILWNPANAVYQQQQMKEVGAAGAKLRMQLQFVEASTLEEINRAFATIAKAGVDAVLVTGDPTFLAYSRELADLALSYRIPAIGAGRPAAESGMLAAYGPDVDEDFIRAATYVDKILKGAKPADLPIELTRKFELVVNAKTARSLAITLPPSLVARADLVIE